MVNEEIKITIGRSANNDVVLADNSISRLHAEMIYCKDGKLLLVDCHSSNGTKLNRNGNEKQISQEYIMEGDVLVFGDVSISIANLLESVSTKIPSSDTNLRLVSESVDSNQKPWVNGSQLVRCQCGAVKQKAKICQECGK